MASTAGPSRSGTGAGAASLANPPDDLKAIAPFLQRANETRKADPALSYWCTYHAAQMGIARAGSVQPASKAFLMSLMDSLESQKAMLEGNDIVHGGDIVAKAHVENTVLKVFAGADNEDRTGNASRATARRFLAAGNFIEVLTNFGPLDVDMEEKLKYSKWKAADIAKALREGRQPTPGPAGGLPEEEKEALAQEQSPADETDGQNVDAVAELQATGSRLGGLSATPLPSREELDAEMARLTASSDVEGQSSSEQQTPTVLSPSSPAPGLATGQPKLDNDDATSQQSRRAASRLSYDGRSEAQESDDVGSPNFSKPTWMYRQESFGSASTAGLGSTGDPSLQAPHFMPPARSSPGLEGAVETFSHFPQNHDNVHQAGLGQREAHSGSTSPYPRPLPQPPSGYNGLTASAAASGGDAGSAGSRSPLPIPPGFSTSAHGMHPSQPQSATTAQGSYIQPSAPPAPTQPPPQATAPVAALAPAPSQLPTALDLNQTARVQKLAKWAVSALDYDDLETARKQLREALDICEGRAAPATNAVSSRR